MFKKNIFLILFIIYIIFPVLSFAKTISGQVIKVSDGDTIVIQTKQFKKIKIRLAEIDTPEMAQPYGPIAQKALSKLVLSKTVMIHYKNKDRYKRIVGRVYLNTQDICAEMVGNGHAWVYRDYSDDYYLYLLEYWARLNQKGLWALPAESRTPPWEWRKNLKSSSKHKTTYAF